MMHAACHREGRGFTLVEILVVVAIMGMVLAMGVPAMSRILQKEGMRKAVSDVVEGCANARAEAIFSGKPADLVIKPRERSLEVGGGHGSRFSAVIPAEVGIELLGVNFFELQQAEEARIRFYPNGTSDEFTLVLHSSDGQWRRISLEVVTGLADVEVIK